MGFQVARAAPHGQPDHADLAQVILPVSLDMALDQRAKLRQRQVEAFGKSVSAPDKPGKCLTPASAVIIATRACP